MSSFLQVLLSAPIYLVLAIGIVYAVISRRQHPRVSTVALLALGGFLALDITGTVVSTIYFNMVLPENGGAGIPTLAVRGFFVVQSIVHAGFLFMAITAATLDRSPPAR